MQIILMKIMYAANILVAGWVGISSLFFPEVAHRTVFESTVAYSEAIRMAGALWWGIFLLSVLGLFFPRQMSLVFLLQFIYKGSWLMVAALPALLTQQPFPRGMAGFFVAWVLLLPFVIPWKDLFGA